MAKNSGEKNSGTLYQFPVGARPGFAPAPGGLELPPRPLLHRRSPLSNNKQSPGKAQEISRCPTNDEIGYGTLLKEENAIARGPHSLS
jgi:hypothetical protein